MDEATLKKDFEDLAEVLLVDPRWLRRFIKRHLLNLGQTALGVVPHTRCYSLPRAEWDDLVRDTELGLPPRSTNTHVLLLSAPPARGTSIREREQQLRDLQRSALHGSVHLLLDERVRAGRLTAAQTRARIERLGRTEFEEIRSALEHDDLLLPPGTDLDVYKEFAAVFLELTFFDPELLVTTFPGLEEPGTVLEVLSEDIDLEALRKRSRQAPVLEAADALAGEARASKAPPPIARSRATSALRKAARERQRGQDARALVLSARGARSKDSETRERALMELEGDARRLTLRLEKALGRPQQEPGDSPWHGALRLLAERAAQGSRPRTSAEYRVLRELELAVGAFENPGFIVDVPSWIFSLGKRRAVRRRTATHTLFVVRHVEAAREASARADLTKQQRTTLDSLLGFAGNRAREQVRSSLRSHIQKSLDAVRLRPRSGPEEQGRAVLTEELLDQMLERGFLSLSQLRDGVSRNDLKLPDLASAKELRRGDPLLRLDARLARELDGIYRRGDVYLRWLQKLTSLAFGTRVGRVLALWLLLPALGAFTLVEGTVLIAGPLARWLGAGPLHFHWPSFLVTIVILVGLLHSEWVRIVFRAVLGALGGFLGLIFLRLPRAVLGGVAMQRLLSQPGFRAFARMGLLPAALAAITFVATPLAPEQRLLRWGLTLATFLVVAVVMGSRIGWWLEDFYLEQVAPAWSTLSRQWLPSLFRAINRTFSAAMDALDRASHAIGEILRFRRSLSPWGVVLAGGAGLVWAALSYLIRLYVTLLVEPEINPVKHFPIVTVAHKLMLPFLPDLLVALERPLSLLGPVFGGALAGITVFLLPSIFGFLAWEFKSNYRLYRRTRSVFIEPQRFGPHRETCRELLVEGLHSGTVPKLFERLRRTAQKRSAARLAAKARGSVRGATPRDQTGSGRFHQGLQQVETSLRHLLDRQLLPPLLAAPRWSIRDLRIGPIAISSNRLKLKLVSDAHGARGSVELTIEQLGGWLVASLSRTGFLDGLSEHERTIFENAVNVLYHRAQVDLVREQIDAELGDRQYDILERGLVVHSDASPGRVTFSLDSPFRKKLKARIRDMKKQEIPQLLAVNVLYRRQRVTYKDWEYAWKCAVSAQSPIPRLTVGPSLLGHRGAEEKYEKQ